MNPLRSKHIPCLAILAVMQPRQALSSAGLALGFWLIFGALAELAERSRLGKMRPLDSFGP